MGQGVLASALSRVDGTLSCEGVPLDALARAVGTPAYVYSAATVRGRYAVLDAALAAVPHRIHYACKANGNLALLSLLRDAGAAIDVVSGGELHRARHAGFPPSDIIFGGVGKSRREIEEALGTGVGLLSIESLSELRLVEEVAAALGTTAPVGIRVNPEISVASIHDYIKTGQKGDKFGVPYDQAEEAILLVQRLPHVRLVAIGMHIGSQLTSLDAYAKGLERLEGLIERARSVGVETLEHLDVGGGLFVPYNGESPVDLSAYADVVVASARRTGLSLIVEPGRFLVADAGILLTRILYRKQSGGRELLVTDAGMTDLLRPSHYQAYHRIEPVTRVAGGTVGNERPRFDVVGPICESGDFLAIDRELEDVGEGDLLCLFTVGAYGYAMSSNYNARGRPVEVLVDDDRWAVVTRRETYDDLVRLETLAPDWREI